jgi:hypothetical protein
MSDGAILRYAVCLLCILLACSSQHRPTKVVWGLTSLAWFIAFILHEVAA